MDECVLNPNLNDCTENQICVNTPGSFECSCVDGYEGDPCTDIDECATSIDNCDDVTENCTNNDGSYECACTEGYSGSPCADIDECATEDCGENAICTNTDGSFECSCAVGFTGSEVNTL